MSADLPKPDYAHNMRIIGHCDQGGRPDGVQIMVHRGYAYIGHMFSKGFSVVDVRDARNPRAVNYFRRARPTPGTSTCRRTTTCCWSSTPRTCSLPPSSPTRRPTTRAARQGSGTAERKTVASATGPPGLAVYDISKPEAPRRIGFMAVDGGGIHRIWYTGGRWAYVSALLDGFTDYIFMTVDMSDPANPREAGRWWIPGMNQAAGETPSWPATSRYGLHHAIVHGDTAYAAWRDAGMVVIDVADRTRPKLVTHRNWSPPFGGGTHNCLPLPDRDLLIVLDEAVLDHQEDGLKLIWVFDNRVRENPVSIATFPTPAEADYVRKGGHFGPHNIHENRPGTFVSSELIFATYQNAGVRVFDIRDPYRPKEVGALVPPKPARMVDHRPNRAQVIQSADVCVDAAGLIYSTDYNGGLYILELGT